MLILTPKTPQKPTTNLADLFQATLKDLGNSEFRTDLYCHQGTLVIDGIEVPLAKHAEDAHALDTLLEAVQRAREWMDEGLCGCRKDYVFEDDLCPACRDHRDERQFERMDGAA